MENIIGKAKSYLEEKGIDTSNMSMEEIIAKYQELLESEEETADDLADTVVEQDQEIADKEEELAEEDVSDEDEEEITDKDEPKKPIDNEVDKILKDYQSTIKNLQGDARTLVDKLILMLEDK